MSTETLMTDLAHILPEMVLAGTALFLFALAAAFRKRNNAARFMFPTVAVLGLLVALTTLLVREPAELAATSSRFFSMLSVDPFSIFFRALALTAALLGVLLTIGSTSVHAGKRGEYLGLVLVMAMGMCLLAGASNWIMIFVAMETVSLCSYLLTGFDGSRKRSREAGLKYVLYGGVASGIMLFGISLLYGLYGDLTLHGLHRAVTGAVGSGVLADPSGQWASLVAVVFILGGLGFKIAAVPFHMWCPDAYEGAPTSFTALLSVGPKAAAFALVLRFFYVVFGQDLLPMQTVANQLPWLLILGLISAATMTIGNLSALVQDNLKRLLAYSSIAHAGYLLMGVVAGGSEGFEAVALYLLVYVLMNMGAFAVVAAIQRKTGSENIKDYRGLSKKAPVLCLAMAVFMFSLTGLPPTAGFIGKFYLFRALIERGDFWYIVLALVGVLNSVISLFYYVRVLKAMYLESPEQEPVLRPAGRTAAGLAVALALPTLILGVLWQPLAWLATWSARIHL